MAVSVASRCIQSDPSTTQRFRTAKIADGLLTQNFETIGPDAYSQATRNAIRMTRRTRTIPAVVRQNPVPGVRSPAVAPRVAARGEDMRAASDVGPERDAILQLVPQIFVQACELRIEANVEDV